MLNHPTLDLLHELGLHGMAKGFREMTDNPESHALDHAEWLGILLERESTLRQQKRFESRAKNAKLRHLAAVEDVDYRTPRGLDRTVFLKLAGCDWIRERRHCLLTGPAGVGKSWLACALGYKACRENLSVLYQRVPRLFAALALARGDGRYAKLLHQLHDLVRGKDVSRWSWETDTKIILPQDPDHPATAIPVETLKVKFPKTFAFFKGFEKEIRACALLAQFFDPKSAPFYSSYNVGDYTYAPFKVVWKEICQEIEAVVIEDPDRSVIPDHKLVMVAFDKPEPAYFLSGLLNSIPIGLFVRSYAVQTSISGHIFNYVAFPQFNSKDATHKQIAKLARDCHSAMAAAVGTLEEKLNQAVSVALGIPPANLTVMRKELQILRGGAVDKAA